MPDAVFYFCRSCGYRGKFVTEETSKNVWGEVKCPKCYEPMVRQDVGWLKAEGKMTGKEEGK